MFDWARDRPAWGSAHLYCTVAQDHGIAPEVVLSGTGLTPAATVEPLQMVDGPTEITVARNLIAALPDIGWLSIDLGMRYHTTTHGLMGSTGATASTGREAFAVSEHFLPLSWARCNQTHADDGTWFTITLDSTALPVDVQHFFAQREIASTVSQARDVAGEFGSVVPIQAWFRQQAPRDRETLAAYERLLGAPPVFDAEVDRIAIPSEVLDVPLPGGNAAVHALMREAAERELVDLAARATVSGQVREVLLTTLASGPTQDSVAHALMVSGRTLRRQLAAEGTTFRDEVERVRQLRAEALLLDPANSVAHVARETGYDNAPAFTAAFRRWMDLSPTEFRAQRLNGRAGGAG